MHNSPKLSPCAWLAQKDAGVPLSCDKDGSFHTSNMVNDLAVINRCGPPRGRLEDKVVPGEAETRHH
jgi:hypothetical protein